MSLTLYPLGVGDAFAGRYYSTALALEAEGRWLLIDCPHPIRKMMLESAASIDVGDVDGVVLTHLHGDHVSGLEGFAFYNRFKCNRRTALVCHPEVAADLWPHHLKVVMQDLLMPDGARLPPLDFEAYFEHHPVTETEVATLGPFRIECRRTIHHIPTTAVRITAGGRCIAYSADTMFDPTLIAWLAEADLVVHETNHAPHTPYPQLAALPEALRARMRLAQYSDDFDWQASTIEALREGQVYPV